MGSGWGEKRGRGDVGEFVVEEKGSALLKGVGSGLGEESKQEPPRRPTPYLNLIIGNIVTRYQT